MNMKRYLLILIAGAWIMGGIMVGAGMLIGESMSSSANEIQLLSVETPGEIRFTGQNSIVTAHGIFQEWDITNLELNPNALEESVVDIQIDIASIDTGNAGRDQHLLTADFFDVSHYPAATLTLSNIEAKVVDEDGIGTYKADVMANIHGIEKMMAIDMDVIATEPVQIRGEIILNRLEFGVGDPYNVLNPFSIHEEIRVTFTATLPIHV
jgi:polyisoprenoid-binding protein YceI